MLTAAIDRTADLFGRLAGAPHLLFAVCLAANAVLLPYEGVSRDAKQYAAQVVQAGTGRYGDDLFFRYGDQSSATVLPVVLARPAAWFGVEPVFLVAYLVANALRLLAAQRLVLRVLGPSPGAAAGLLLFAAAPVPIGWGTFAVNEAVLTARAPAVAAALLGLDFLLAGRPWRAAGCLAAALALHPLMAAPAAAVAAGWVAFGWATTPRRWAAVGGGLVAVAAAAAAYLARTYGTLDAPWRELALVNNPIAEPARWDAVTWARLAGAAGCAWAVGRALPDPAARRFLGLVVAVAAAGLAAAAVAAHGPWALVFQAQPARAIWLLEVFWFPLGLVTVGRLWGAGPGARAGAVALLVLLTAVPNLAHPAAAQVLTAATAVGLVVARVGGWTDWVWRGLAAGLLAWGAVWYPGFVPGRLADEFRSGPFYAPAFDERVHVIQGELGPWPRLAVCTAVLAGAAAVGRPRAGAAGALAVWAAGAAGAYLVPQTEWAARRDAPRAGDVRFVRETIARAWGEPGPPTVYWPGGRMDTVWFDLGANSYFTYWQLSPNIFFRGNAVEGDRRWRVCAPFEADPDRPPPGGPPAPRPTAGQFRTLTAEPAVDFVVLPYDLGGAAGTNGAVWVYDCRRLRAAAPD